MTTDQLVSLLSLLIALSSLLISWRTFAISRTMGTEDIVFGEKIKMYKELLEKLMKVLNAAYVVESHMEIAKANSIYKKQEELNRIQKLYHDAQESAFYSLNSNAHLITKEGLSKAQAILSMANFHFYNNYEMFEDVKKNNKSRLEKTEALINDIREEIKIDKVHSQFVDRLMNTLMTWQAKD